MHVSCVGSFKHVVADMFEYPLCVYSPICGKSFSITFSLFNESSS